MSSRLRLKETDAPGQGLSLYDQDLAQWVGRQIEMLRSSRTTALDVPHLTLELEGLTKRDEQALGSQLKRIMTHLLKQRHPPQRATRSWADSIANGREEIADILEQSPSLRRTLPGLLIKNYPRAVSQAARDTRLPPETFPSKPPFSLAAVIGEEGSPEA
jgi:Domain of unknown function DUF29